MVLITVRVLVFLVSLIGLLTGKFHGSGINCIIKYNSSSLKERRQEDQSSTEKLVGNGFVVLKAISGRRKGIKGAGNGTAVS